MLGPISVGVKVIAIARIRIVTRIAPADLGLFSLPRSSLLLLPRRHGGESAKDVETRDTASAACWVEARFAGSVKEVV